MNKSPKPVAVLLHGFPDVAANWSEIQRLLEAQGIATLAPALPGYSAQTPAHRQAAPAPAVDWLLALLATEPRPVHLVGHDWGAVVAWLAAAACPERFASISALAIPPLKRLPMAILKRPRQWWLSRYMLYFQVPALPERLLARSQARAIARLWSRWSPEWNGGEPLCRARAHFADPRNGRSALAWYRALPRLWQSDFKRAWRWRRHKIRIPSLVLMGEQDGCMLPSLLADCARLEDFPAGIQVELMPDCGHFLHLERPQAVAAWLGEHIWRSNRSSHGEQSGSGFR